MKTLDFWFDYTCPYAYLGSTQVEALAKRTRAELTYRPMLLGGVFAANGTAQNLSETLSPNKAKHNLEDMQRWAKLFSVTLTMPATHPMRSVEALRATLVTRCDPKVIRGFYDAYWVRNENIASPEVIARVVSEAGHDPVAVAKQIQEPSVKEDLRTRTDEAIGLGIFGAPAYIVDGKTLYWGQDRAHFVADCPFSDLLPPVEPKGTKHQVEFYWDFSSPYAYLASTQIEALAARTGATILSRPFLLGGLFKAIGQADAPILSWSDAKRAYIFEDMKRWAKHWGVPFRFPSRFPMNSIKALRAYLALPEAKRADFRARTFAAYWAEDRDIASDHVLRELLGADADAVFAKIQSPEVKQELIACTQRAEREGLFGAPAWVVDGKELFWGQDRIDLLERALRA